MSDGRLARGRRTRQAILDATGEVIREMGADAVTHRVVAQRAGVSLAATTYHFDTLDDLFVAAFGLLTERAVTQIEALADDVLAGRRDLVAAAIDFVRITDHEHGFVADALTELTYAASRNTRLHEPLAHLLSQMSEPFAPLIGQRDATVLVRSLTGLVAQFRSETPAAAHKALRRDLARLFDLFGLVDAVQAQRTTGEQSS